jgi:hypothetical protein
MKTPLRNLLLVFTLGILALGSLLVENARAGQPHMASAIESLRTARHQLEMARPDKGGHRENAIRIIDNAFSEVKAGMDAAD